MPVIKWILSEIDDNDGRVAPVHGVYCSEHRGIVIVDGTVHGVRERRRRGGQGRGRGRYGPSHGIPVDHAAVEDVHVREAHPVEVIEDLTLRVEDARVVQADPRGRG